MIGRKFLRRLGRDTRGSFVVETALIAPTLLMFAFGTFEIGTIVARQHQLQSAAAETATIALTAAQGASFEINTLRDILATSTDLPANQVTVTRFYRCGDSAATVNDPVQCNKLSSGTGAAASTPVVSSYLRIVLTDTYTPFWEKLGLGEKISFQIERTVMLS